MIVNNSKLKSEDEKFLISWSMKKLLWLRVLYVILGLISIGLGINKLVNENIMELSFFIVGVIFIFFVFYLKVMAKKAFRKNSYLDTEYSYQFGEDKVLMKAISHNASGTSEMTYDFFDFYYVSDSSLYLKAKGKRYFYVVNNDGYESGSVDELMKLLEGKVIRK